MDDSTQNSNCFCYKELYRAFSYKKCCFFLLIFLLITFAVVGLAIFFVILILKPHKPVFSVRGIKIKYYNLSNDHSNLNLLLSSVLSLTLNAENHNKFGIGYSPSRFLVSNEGLPIGTIRVPRFFQPPHSDDLSVQTRVLLQRVNVSRIVANASLQEKSKQNMAQMKILGDVKAHLWLLHINLINIKVALDCDMNMNLRELAFTNEFYAAKVIKSELASVVNNSNGISMKCSSAFCI